MKPSTSGYFLCNFKACSRFSTSPLITSLVCGAISFRSLIISGISSKCAPTLLISFFVRRCTVRVARFSRKSVGNHSRNSSIREYPSRVLTETGRRVADLAWRIHSTASSGVRIIPEPPPVLQTFLSGQPILRSRPSKPSSSSLLASKANCSGFFPQICATIGVPLWTCLPSFGFISSRSSAFSRPRSEAKLETLVNSV